MVLNQTDINVRLQLSGQAYSEMGKQLSDDFRYGRNCSVKHLNNLALLNVYIEILEQYQVGTDIKQCFTEQEIQKVCDNISMLTGICFQPINYTYTPNI